MGWLSSVNNQTNVHLFLVHQMGKLVRLERDIYSGLKEHAQHLDSATRDIEDYVREVAGVYSECGDSEECDDQQTESILGNPIHNYQLLKRVTVTWKKVLKTLKAIDGKSILSKIKKRKKKEKLPTDIDLNLAAKSLNNLKDVYRIPADEMAEGNLLGVQTGAKLNEQDLFYLASSAANQVILIQDKFSLKNYLLQYVEQSQSCCGSPGTFGQSSCA